MTTQENKKLNKINYDSAQHTTWTARDEEVFIDGLDHRENVQKINDTF